MPGTNQADVKAPSDMQPVQEPVSFSATERNTPELSTKIAQPKSRQRASVEELKLDFSSRILFFLMVGVLHVMSLLPDFVLFPLGIVSGYAGYPIDRRRRKLGCAISRSRFPSVVTLSAGESFGRRISISAAVEPSMCVWADSSIED
jgi:hypothetical protein